MVVTLVGKSHSAAEVQVGIQEFPVVLGRGSGAAVRFTDPWISSSHCEMREDRDGLVLRDLNSRHGTYVNGERITERTLAPGDSIMLGLTEVTVAVCADSAGSSDSRSWDPARATVISER